MNQQTMTIKELAEIAGCNEKTIRRIGKSIFPALFKKGVKVEFDNAQALQMMRSLPKKNMVGQMSEVPRTNARGLDAKLISQIVAETVKQLIPYLQPKNELAGKQFPELPPVNYRLELSAIIRAYASKKGILFPFAWEEFYQRVLYRLQMNITTLAKNAGMERLDYAEENGLIEKLYQLAKEEF